ncbi:MAG TPA: hypothetical protein VEG38_08865 [Acidimicrobiia bacterium]|nr:hypothetical protein [Acidimicrobiia bacterium]
MANSLFSQAREGFAVGEVNWSTGVIKVALVRGYTFDDTDKFVSDVTGGGGTLHATSAALGSKTATNGVLDAADVTFTTPAADANDHSILIFQSSAVGGGADVAATAQRVIAWIDTATGLPIRPNGANITISWDDGANRILKI